MDSVPFREWLTGLRASVSVPADASQSLATNTLPHHTTPATMEYVQPNDREATTMASVILPAGATRNLDANTLPPSTTTVALESIQPSGGLAAILASLARAEAKEEAEARHPRTLVKQYEAAISRESGWLPEHLVPLLPPPSNNVSDEFNALKIFWNHVRTNSQHWPVCLTMSETLICISAYHIVARNGSSHGQIGLHHPRRSRGWPIHGSEVP